MTIAPLNVVRDPKLLIISSRKENTWPATLVASTLASKFLRKKTAGLPAAMETKEPSMSSRGFLCLALAILATAGCSGGSPSTQASDPPPSLTPAPAPSPSPTATPAPAPAPGNPAAAHVVLVVLENHSFSHVIGNVAMPYFNSLASQYSLAANYFAVAHPSIGNYFMLTTGVVESTDDAFTGIVSDDNIARALTASGKTWRAYMESLPAAGYTGGDVPPYLKHHDPFAYFNDVVGSALQAANIVPFSQFAMDLALGRLPSFAFVTPNEEHDAHSCPGNAPACPDNAKLAAADIWLRTNIDPLLHNPAFSNGVLIVTFDEGVMTDTANGGGQVATVLAGPLVKKGFRSVTFYQHPSTLRLVLDLLEVNDHPGASLTAPAMTEFFP
jgi:phosphatidylinositol-3-phosphatase